jgi:hypothetical protein
LRWINRRCPVLPPEVKAEVVAIIRAVDQGVRS